MPEPMDGHDGPYGAPLVLPAQTVAPEWIDYNGHMNVGYYTLAFDQGLDAYLQDTLGIGPRHVLHAGQGPYALQAHVHYLNELHEGERYRIEIILHDHDQKRMHVVMVMRNQASGATAAICEQVMMNVDLSTRRSTPYPNWAVARMAALKAAHAGLPRPAQMGASIGLGPR